VHVVVGCAVEGVDVGLGDAGAWEADEGPGAERYDGVLGGKTKVGFHRSGGIVVSVGPRSRLGALQMDKVEDKDFSIENE